MAEANNQSKKITQKWWFWVLLILFLGFILMIGGCGTLLYFGAKTSDQILQNVNSSITNTTTTNTAESVTAKQYKAGEDVQVAQVRWKLMEAKDLGDTLKGSASNYPTFTDDKKANANSKFVQVSIEVENLDTSMKSVTDLSIMDGKNRKFTASSDTSEWVPQDKQMFLLSNLNPNVPQQFIAIYEVPKDATNLKMEVGDLSLFGSDKAYISLGL